MNKLSTDFAHKIKTADEVRRIIGRRPRRDKVIMCHGVFDVVHPGHLRHLLYAKTKASILIASLTADAHVEKGRNRPHVPQDLRALNLAAYEMVDYVIIDEHATPIENIKHLEPDFFAKGYEYVESGLSPKTNEEYQALSAYGGEMIFTPGDIVYSSSALIDLAPPRIRVEKLLRLLEMEGLSFDRLRRAVAELRGHRVHVVGDTIVDSHTQTTLVGGQIKTPTVSVLYTGRVDYVGGAGVVAKHLRAAGGEVVLSTVLGEDGLKDFVVGDLREAGVDCLPVIDPTRPTTNKNAIVTDGYRLLKIDTLDNRSISDGILHQISAAVRETECEAVVFSDFRHGIFNSRTVPRLIDAISGGVYRVADSQMASRWGNITDFKGFDLITPNEREARFVLADQDSGVRPLASALYDAAQCKTLILKLGDRGVYTCRSGDHEALDSYFSVDSFVEQLVDPVGAGDALLAYATLAMLATGSAVIATILGSMAAACACEVDGNLPVPPQDVMNKIDAAEKSANYL
ncbi:MAG: PfkB family carbohydrate kinase [Kiloniellales bacterium]